MSTKRTTAKDGSKLRSVVCSLMAHIQNRGAEVRMVGGCVRDGLLGLPPKDYDLATTMLPQDLLELSGSLVGLKTLPTGIAFGTVTLLYEGQSVEVTTLREDLACDGRRAEVRFGTSFERDAARRDFTINAMYEDQYGKIYDYYGGREDLALGILRFVGEPDERIREDYLRILRFFRFAIRFDFTADPRALNAISVNSSSLKRLSRERCLSELVGIFSHLASIVSTSQEERRAYLFSKMISCGVLSDIHWDMDEISFGEQEDVEKVCALMVKCFAALQSLHPASSTLNIVFCLHVLFEYLLERVLQWFEDMHSSTAMQKHAQLWAKALFEPQKDICTAFLWLNQYEKIVDDLPEKALLLESLEALGNIQKELSFLVHSSHALQRMHKAIENLHELLSYEVRSYKLRKAKPFLSAEDLMNTLHLEGKALGEALKRSQELQWRKKVKNSSQALAWIKREFA